MTLKEIQNLVIGANYLYLQDRECFVASLFSIIFLHHFRCDEHIRVFAVHTQTR